MRKRPKFLIPIDMSSSFVCSNLLACSSVSTLYTSSFVSWGVNGGNSLNNTSLPSILNCGERPTVIWRSEAFFSTIRFSRSFNCIDNLNKRAVGSNPAVFTYVIIIRIIRCWCGLGTASATRCPADKIIRIRAFHRISKITACCIIRIFYIQISYIRRICAKLKKIYLLACPDKIEITHCLSDLCLFNSLNKHWQSERCQDPKYYNYNQNFRECNSDLTSQKYYINLFHKTIILPLSS